MNLLFKTKQQKKSAFVAFFFKRLWHSWNATKTVRPLPRLLSLSLLFSCIKQTESCLNLAISHQHFVSVEPPSMQKERALLLLLLLLLACSHIALDPIAAVAALVKAVVGGLGLAAWVASVSGCGRPPPELNATLHRLIPTASSSMQCNATQSVDGLL